MTSTKGTENETGSWEKKSGGASEGVESRERVALSKLDRGEYVGGISKGEKGSRERRQESGERQRCLPGLKQFVDKVKKERALPCFPKLLPQASSTE